MKKLNKILLFAPTLLLTACGYGLKEIYSGDVYNSVDYYKNFYKEWDDDINYKKDGNKIINKDEKTYELDDDEDLVFRSFNDENFVKVQSDAEKYSYSSDIYEPPEGQKSYGQTYALSKNEPTFKYGYVSKLFNGQMFCHSYYELARVQIGEEGFGTTFKKEIRDYKYFALNLKASLDYRKNGKSTNVPGHTSDINLIINFYCKSDGGNYIRHPVSYDLTNIPTNAGEQYVFFGFSLDKIDISRLAGISIEYELLNDTYKKEHPDETWTHCLLLYELFLPESTWH